MRALLALLGGAAAAAPLDEVIIVFKTHFDIGYTDMAAKVVERYRTAMIDQALAVVDRSCDRPAERQFVWTIPGWPLAKILEPVSDGSPERRARIERAFREGRFVAHALPFTLHTELLEVEDLVRGLAFASGLARRAGLPLPRDAKMTDVPCHAWILPTLLRHAGVEFLHLGCNAGSRSPEIPILFWWEGPDGSKLLTMYSAEGYGTSLLPPAGWPHRTWLALIHTGDNHGPPRPEEVDALLAEAGKKLPGARVRIGRLSDFADAILAEKPELPVVRADMPDSWIHGPMSDPAGAALARSVRPRIAAAEALGVLLAAWTGRRADRSPALSAAWECSLLYGEHTWGGALSWVTGYARVEFPYGEAWKADRAKGRFARLEASWAEHTAYIERARDLALPVLDGSLRALADAVRIEGPRVVVFNPLPWRRSGLVELPAGCERVGALKPAGEDAVHLVERRGGAARFFARDLPAMGYRTYVPVDPRGADPNAEGLGFDEAAAAIESSFFRAILDPARGTIRSLIEKGSGRELVDPGAEEGFGRILYERFDANRVAAYVRAYVKIDAAWAINEIGKPAMPPAAEVPYRAAGPAACSLRFERTPLAVAAAMRSAAGSSLPFAMETRVILHRDLACADIEVRIEGKPADPWPEAGWIAFPFAIELPGFRIGRQGSIVDPARDFAPGANRHLYAVTSGVAIIDPQGRGIGLCSPDAPLISLDSPGIMKYSRDFVPRRPHAYVHLFNNHWTTNFRMWNEGTWTARVRLWAFVGYRADRSLIAPSWECRLPPLAALSDGPAGELPVVAEGLALARGGVLATALVPNPDGEGILLRLWEQAGEGGPCPVRLPRGLPASEALPCDLRGRPAGPAIPIREGAFEAPIGAFAPASFILR